jgi:hypothetical protein
MIDLRELAKEIDLDAHSAKDALEAAMAADAGRPQLSPADDLKRFDILDPGLPGWKDAIDDTIRRQLPNRTLGPVPRLTFSSRAFMQTIGDREVFRPRLDTLMLHLGHPLMQKAKGALTRRRFPGPAAVSRWTARHDHVPEGADALIVLHMEELGINALRETFHHWIRTVRLPVYGNRLSDALPAAPAADFRDARSCKDADAIQRARDVLDEFEFDLQQVVKNRKKELTREIAGKIQSDGDAAIKEADKRYKSRQGELSALIAENTMNKLEREINKLKVQRQQGVLFDADAYMDRLDRDIQMKQEELDRRRHHYDELRTQLTRERERILKDLLPRRYTLEGDAQVFPVAVEIRLPAREGGDR